MNSKSLRPSPLISVAVWLLTLSPLQAHHSAAMYDASKTLALEGTLKVVQISNPHSWFWVVVPNAQGGTDLWGLEAGGAADIARRAGGDPKAMFLVGQKIRFTFHPLRDGRLSGQLVTMSFPDGKVFGDNPLTLPDTATPK